MARILLIEDDDDVRQLVSAALGRAGHEVQSARSGGQGVEMHQTAAADLMVVDLLTPGGVSGMAAIEGLRQRGDRTPILAISGAYGFIDFDHPFTSSLRGALDAGADAFLQKPFSLKALLHAVARLLEGDDPSGARGLTPKRR